MERLVGDVCYLLSSRIKLEVLHGELSKYGEKLITGYWWQTTSGWGEMACAVLPQAPLQEMGMGLEGPSTGNSVSILELHQWVVRVSTDR